MKLFYILDNNNKAVLTEDAKEWARFLENRSRCIVGRDEFQGTLVSTVFLGLDHSFSQNGPPLLFETMVFKGKFSEEVHQERYSTWEEAEEGHKKAVEEYL